MLTGAMTHNRKGFTLIELMIVIALIALITAMALPSLSSSFRLSLGSAARELAATIRECTNYSLISGQICRLVYDLEKQEYWAETGQIGELLHTSESLKKEENRARFSTQARKAEDDKKTSTFVIQRAVTRSKKTLPRGVEFLDLITEQSKESLTKGVLMTHIFPHGWTEQAIIHLKDSSDHQMSLIVESIGGRTRVIDRYVTDKEAENL